MKKILNFSWKTKLILSCHDCSDHSNLEMEAECLMKNLSYWNLNISRKKKKLKTSCKATMLGKLTEMEQNWIMFTPLSFYQKSSVTHLRDSHMKFTGKNKVSNTTWAKLHGLIGQKPAKQFSVSSCRKCLC